MAMTDGMGTTRVRGQADMDHREDEHRDLIQRACRDWDAFGELYLRHYQDVFHYCVRRLFDRHLAEDVTEIVFFKVMHHLSSFDGEAAGFRSWLLRIATNAVNDHLREARRRAQGLQRIVRNTRVDAVDAVDADDDLTERKASLQRALLSLKPKYQTVITLRFFEKMKLTEIAACLGENPSTCTHLAFPRRRKAAQKVQHRQRERRVHAMNDEKYIEEFVKDLPFEDVNVRHRDALKARLLDAFPGHRLQPTDPTVPLFWRTIMKTPIAKLAAAAAIIAVLWLGIHLTGHSNVAWADVMRSIQNARTLVYQTTLTLENGQRQVLKTMVRDPDRMRIELPDGRTWIADHSRGQTLLLDPNSTARVVHNATTNAQRI